MITISELTLIIIAIIILLVWGPDKIPKIAQAIGRAKYYYEKAKRGELPEEKKETRRPDT